MSRGGWCIGNGQRDNTKWHEKCLCLNCMHDQMAVMKERYDSEMDEYDVRRLTPTECARLQGFPADWCADVPHSDSAEYKLWGNGIALPSILPMIQNAVNLIEDFKKERGIE